jgi:hypothetical protein
MRVCLDKSGKLIEMQSLAIAGTLTQNAINAGYKKEDIIEKEVTDKEWFDIMYAIPSPAPIKSKLTTLEEKITTLSDALIKKNVLTAADVEVKAKG